MGVFLRASGVGVAVGACVGWSGLAVAGDVTPPAGAVTPTMRTLEEVEPRIPVGDATTPGDASSTYVISEPGSYFLTGDVEQLFAKDGIRIDASRVSLDLRGFTVRGISGAGDGIASGGLVRDLHVFDGAINGFEGNGMDLEFAFGSLVENLRVRGNGGAGIVVGGPSVVRSCVAIESGSDGFRSNGIVVFENCSGTGNSGDGFNVHGTLVNCQAIANTLDGFEVWLGAMTNCTSHGNAGNAYVVGAAGSVALENCTARFGTNCFMAMGECTFLNCSARQAMNDGFHVLVGCTLEACTARLNGDDGFQLTTGCTLHRCRSESNGYGYYVPTDQDLVRIEGCTGTWNTNTGFLMNGDLCLVVRNFARGNGLDFGFAGNSQYGPVESALGTIGSTSPWANFGETTVASTKDAARIERKEAEWLESRGAVDAAGPSGIDESAGRRVNR